MCVIINIEDGNFPSYQTLKNAESLNSHGGSIAWLDNGNISYHKGLKAKKINQIINKKLKPNNVKVAIIHFRIASVGRVNKSLCHPFPISEDVITSLKVINSKHDILFHNGTIENWQTMLIESIQGQWAKIPEGELSDSRVMAYLVNEYGHEFLKNVKGWNKFSILTKTGIIKYGDWVKVDNVECSNDYFSKKFYDQDSEEITEEWLVKNDLEQICITKADKELLSKIIKKFDSTYDEVCEYYFAGYELKQIYELFKDTDTRFGGSEIYGRHGVEIWQNGYEY